MNDRGRTFRVKASGIVCSWRKKNLRKWANNCHFHLSVHLALIFILSPHTTYTFFFLLLCLSLSCWRTIIEHRNTKTFPSSSTVIAIPCVIFPSKVTINNVNVLTDSRQWLVPVFSISFFMVVLFLSDSHN